MKAIPPSRMLFAFILLLALTLQACAARPTPAPVSTQAPAAATAAPAETAAPAAAEQFKVKVVTLPFVTFAPYYIAQDEGYFADQGLEVELVNMTAQEEILPALASGQVDVTSGLLSSAMLNSIAKGADIKITSDKGWVDPQGCINWAIVGRRDLVSAGELKTADQLKGKIVNIVPATWLEYYLAKVLETGGLTLNDIQKMNLGAPVMPDAFAKKTIDVAVNSEPWITRFKKDGDLPILALPQEILPDDTGAVQLYGPKLMENKDAGNRFMAAYLKGVKTYNEGATDRNIEIVAKYTQLDPALLKAMCWPALRSDGAVNMESVLNFQKWAISAGYGEKELTAEQLFDGSFLEAANKMLSGE